nr:unnamed protein product [Leishmania braziliensis]
MTSGADGACHAFRYGGPAAVVDPLLSFLFDLRRMEDTVLSTLEHLGVQRHNLPRPFGGGSSASPPQAPATIGNDGAAALPSAPSLPMPVTDPIDSDAHEVVASRSAAPDSSVGGVTPQLLSWLDAQSSAPRSSSALSLRLLRLFVTAAEAGADVFVRDVATREDSHVGQAFKRTRPDKGAAPTEPNEDAVVHGTDSTVLHVGSLTAAEIHTAVQEWRGYEKFLKRGVAEMKATLAAVTAAQPGNSYSCHAKWVEHTRSDAKVTSVVPGSAVLKRNYEELISLNDALATCQAAVHTAYVVLEDNLDVFLEEAQAVDRQERLFQHHLSAARSECAALHALRCHIKRARKALGRCIYGLPSTTNMQPR